MAGTLANLGTALLIGATTVLASGDLRAAGPFDGSWVIDSPEMRGRFTGSESGALACQSLHIPFQIRNNEISSNVAPSASDPTRTTSDLSQTLSVVNGNVQPDGFFALRWGRDEIDGKITGNTLVAQWRSQCGTRSVQGRRVQLPLP